MYSHSVQVQLAVDTLSVGLVEGGTATCQMDKDKLLRILRHQVQFILLLIILLVLCALFLQVVVYQMYAACQVAEKASWIILRAFTRPQFSSALARGGGNYLEACNILLQSPDACK